MDGPNLLALVFTMHLKECIKKSGGGGEKEVY
jgi:hypothetical protein